ncbi:YciI family protein [Pararhodobacter sp.]|uniref:YciI family protein n=1 Tax=Pararhodobacter sp. TaxID=2127056 RepID=UPI002AFFD4FA|nr:YciI family protein [Pararhodobacter sp.]
MRGRDAENWNDDEIACRERGSLALEVFACITSPAKDGPPPPELLVAYLAYQKDLEARGALFLAGPLSDPTGTSMPGAGLIIDRAETIEAARKLAQADPMHTSGRRSFTRQAWRLNEDAPRQRLRLSDPSFDRF